MQIRKQKLEPCMEQQTGLRLRKQYDGAVCCHPVCLIYTLRNARLVFYEDLQDLLELTPKKDTLFIIEDWNAKIGSQEIPGVMDKLGLGVQNEAEKRLTEFCQENTLVIANTLFQQHNRRLYTWTSPDGQY